jgi:uncharacterized OsmC-like protein
LEHDKREAAARAHRVHADSCPVARTIGDCVSINTTLQMEDMPDDIEAGVV